jgi:hypothetical protein
LSRGEGWKRGEKKKAEKVPVAKTKTSNKVLKVRAKGNLLPGTVDKSNTIQSNTNTIQNTS